MIDMALTLRENHLHILKKTKSSKIVGLVYLQSTMQGARLLTTKFIAISMEVY